MSLSTGASLITLSQLLNKVSGLYGLLALLTGFQLSALQLSMYIYSLLALGLTAYLARHIRTQSPLQCLALAWFYLLDSVVNAAYTAAFGVAWFVVLAPQQHRVGGGGGGGASGTMADTAGFTSPEYNVSSAVQVAAPVAGGGIVASSPAGSGAGASAGTSTTNLVLQSSSLNSLGVIISLWAVRLYFCVVMLSYARMVLRQHIARVAVRNTQLDSYSTASSDAEFAENPFAESKAEGRGWRGRLGRVMVAVPRGYWLGREREGEGGDVSWMEGMGGSLGGEMLLLLWEGKLQRG